MEAGRLLVTAYLTGILWAGSGDGIVGRARVIDGDTIEIAGARYRLFGIDAPETRQTCLDADGRPWRCGLRAGEALADRIGGRRVTCRTRGRARPSPEAG